MSLENYDSISERLSDDASFEERLQKYEKILIGLNENNIHLIESTPNPVVEDSSCGFRMKHNRITWDVFRVSDVIDMIVRARDSHIENL
jgi:hypothetical protein